MKAFPEKTRNFILAALLFLLCVLPYMASAEESQGNEESGGEILNWDVSGEGYILPETTENANKLRENTLPRFEEGTGAYFGFTRSLVPWDFLDLNLTYPEEAWKTPFPYYFGVAPELNIPFWVEGTMSIFDDTGHLAVSEYSIHIRDEVFGGTAWYCLGNISRGWEDWMDEAIEVQKPYLGEENTGIIYFLSQVELDGVIGGPRMKALLKQVHAKEMSIQRTYRDERYGVFYIPPTQREWDNWVAELYVWVNMKDYGIERHQVDFLYGREYCQYFNQLWDVQPDQSLFYLEWLPKRILDGLDDEYELSVSDKPPPGPDEYVEKDQWVHIKPKGTEGESGNENSGGEGEEGESSGTQ